MWKYWIDLLKEMQQIKKSEIRIVSFDDEGEADVADMSSNNGKIILTACDKVIWIEGPKANEIVIYRLFE